MGDNPVFKALYFKPKLIKVERNTTIPAQWGESIKTIAAIEDPENIIEDEVGVVGREQITRYTPQPPNPETYDPSLTLSIYTSTSQRNGDPFYRLDPVRAYSLVDKDFLSAFLFRTLFKYSSDGNLVPDLSEDYGIPTENYSIWTFRIKNNCFFENGQEIKPSDIAYGISRRFAVNDIINLEFESPYYPVFVLAVQKDNGGVLYKGPYDRSTGYITRQQLFSNAVFANDNERTIKFILKKPVYDFRDMLTWFCFGTPVPSNTGLANGSDIDHKPISSGPYKINESLSVSFNTSSNSNFTDAGTKPKRYSKLVLIKNSAWNPTTDSARSGKNYQNVIEINFAQNQMFLKNLILNDSNKNSIVLDSVPQSLFNSDGTPTNLFANRVLNFNNGFVNYLGVNCNLITSNEIRQAIYYVIDPTAFINARAQARGFTVPALYASQADQLISPWQYDYVPAQNKSRPNIQYAKTLMSIAATNSPGNYNYVTSANGITLTLPNWSTQDRTFVSTWINNFAQIGIKLKVSYVSNYYMTLLNREKTENLSDLTYFTWCPDWDSASNVFYPIFVNDDLSPIHLLVNQNDSDYSNFINLLNSTSVIDSQANRKAGWQIIQNILMDEMWVIPFCVNNQQMAFGSNVRGKKQKFQTIAFNEIYLVK